MKIKKIYIREENVGEREINFSEKQLIFSHENSQGKTTLIRLLLHSLGFQIPDSIGANYNNFFTRLYMEKNGEQCIIERSNDSAKYTYRTIEKIFLIPEEIKELQSAIFNITELNLMNNLLGVIYIDQTKGPTILNRGEVIKGNKFSVDLYIAGLQGANVELYTNLKTEEQKKLKDYKAIKKISQYKIDNEIGNENIDLIEDTADDIDFNDKIILSTKIKSLKKKIKLLKGIYTENKVFMSVIEEYSLKVKDGNNNEIPVNSETIIDYDDNRELIKMQINSAEIKLHCCELEYNKLNKNEQVQLDLNLNLQEYKKIVDKHLQLINIDDSTINKIVNESNSKVSLYKKQIKSIINRNPEMINYLNQEVIECASILGIRKYIEQKGIFTHNVSNKTGAVLFKTIISFKVAYILGMYKYKGIKLPLIIDSLRNSELSKQGAKDILNLFTEKLSGYQIIVASIYKYDDWFDGEEEVIDRLISIDF